MGAGGAVLVLVVVAVLVVLLVAGVALLVTGAMVRRSGEATGRALLWPGAVLVAVAVGVPLSLPVIGFVRGPQEVRLDLREATVTDDELPDGPTAGSDTLYEWDVDAVDLVLPDGRGLAVQADSMLLAVTEAGGDEVEYVAVRTVAEPIDEARRRAEAWAEELGLPDGSLDEEVVVDGGMRIEVGVQETGGGDRGIARARIDFGRWPDL